MQPFAAGLAVQVSRRVPVVLAGGSQMLAVFALAQALKSRSSESIERTLVATTKWVAFDKSAGTAQLSRQLGAPYVASCPDFLKSRHPGLAAYEEGNVKEGAGAGGSLLLAHTTGGFTPEQLQESIDQTYEELLGTTLSVESTLK
jgi:NaMN:DMB phosphoribosyltransferase